MEQTDQIPVDEDPTVPADTRRAPGRALAVQALLSGARCDPARVSDLLGVSPRTVGRDRAITRGRHDGPLVEGARSLIAETAARGSTSEEREAAGRLVG